MNREPTRMTPGLPVHAVKTYQVAAPVDTHWREATCEEVMCEAHRTGWLTLIDEREFAVRPMGRLLEHNDSARHMATIRRMTDRDQQRAYYIRYLSGRHFTEAVVESGFTRFDFPPGQDCFNTHRIKTDRPAVYVVHGGDWRGNPTGETRTHDYSDNWVEDFAEHQDSIATRVNRG